MKLNFYYISSIAHILLVFYTQFLASQLNVCIIFDFSFIYCEKLVKEGDKSRPMLNKNLLEATKTFSCVMMAQSKSINPTKMLFIESDCATLLRKAEGDPKRLLLFRETKHMYATLFSHFLMVSYLGI